MATFYLQLLKGRTADAFPVKQGINLRKNHFSGDIKKHATNQGSFEMYFKEANHNREL